MPEPGRTVILRERPGFLSATQGCWLAPQASFTIQFRFIPFVSQLTAREQKMAMPVITGAHSRSTWRLGVVLLSVALIALSALAKHSYCSPRTSGSHWISQTCKIQECRRATPILVDYAQAVVRSGVEQQPRIIAEATRRADPPPRYAHFFCSTPLRSPPASL